jgi:hypothetical protein
MVSDVTTLTVAGALTSSCSTLDAVTTTGSSSVTGSSYTCSGDAGSCAMAGAASATLTARPITRRLRCRILGVHVTHHAVSRVGDMYHILAPSLQSA